MSHWALLAHGAAPIPVTPEARSSVDRLAAVALAGEQRRSVRITWRHDRWRIFIRLQPAEHVGSPIEVSWHDIERLIAQQHKRIASP